MTRKTQVPDVPDTRPPLGIEAASAYLDVSQRTVERLIKRGDLPAYRLGKRLIRIKPRDIDALLQRIETAQGA